MRLHARMNGEDDVLGLRIFGAGHFLQATGIGQHRERHSSKHTKIAGHHD